MQSTNNPPGGDVNRDIAEVSLHNERSARGPIAMTRGTARDMLAAAEALKAIERGEKPPELRNSIINPTRTEVETICRMLGVKPPVKWNGETWFSKVMMSVRRGAKKQPHFSDPGKEAAIAGSILGSSFELIPVQSLVPVNAFADARWRIVYGVALSIRKSPDGVCCVEAINDFIAMHDLDRELQAAVDSTNTISWQRWPEFADMSLAYAPSTRPLEYCLLELAALYVKRRTAEIAERLASGEVEIAQARKEFDALWHSANGNFNFADADERRFNAERLHAKPEPTILLDNHPLCTTGNLSVIYAKPKAGKSAVVSAIIGASITDDPLGDYLGFSTRQNTAGHALIHIDTEQSRHDHEQIVLRAMRRADCEQLPPWVRSYCVTDFSTADRHAFLVAEIERANRECHGVFAVLVDGIGDFVLNVNDAEACNEFVLELHALAIRYETILLVILHENPNEDSQKTRGHLGSQLERKAESNIRITKDAEGIMSIYTEKSRHAHIPKTRAHHFIWDEQKATHVSYEKERAVKDETDLVAALFDCDLARNQAGGLQWAEVLQRFVDLKLYKTPQSARRKFQKLLEAGWIRKQGDHYWPAKPGDNNNETP